MPLPEPPPTQTSAPVWAGIGLRFHYHWRVALPSWPADWWQRNYDSLWEWDEPPPLPMTPRQMRIPNFPYPP